MARRMVPAVRNETETGDPAVTFLAEKLITRSKGQIGLSAKIAASV